MKDKEPFFSSSIVYQDVVVEHLYKMLMYEFPNIKNLKIEETEARNLSITFDEGEYTKKDIELKIQEYRNNSREFKMKFDNSALYKKWK